MAPDPKNNDVMAQTETDAFNEAIANYSRESIQPTGIHGPERLFNIYSGELEPGDANKKYVIVSYICDPSKLPKYPRRLRRASEMLHTQRDGAPTAGGRYRFGVPVSRPLTPVLQGELDLEASLSRDLETTGLDNDAADSTTDGTDSEPADVSWEYDTRDFEQVVRLACQEESTDQKWIVEIDEDFEEKAAKLARPAFTSAFSDEQSEYAQEVCLLAAVEAQRRGLKYVWMDSLCIDQTDPQDKAEQIPRMTDYFRKAEVCVVVSEMLRRQYSHHLDCLGPDVLDALRVPPWDLAGPRKSDAWYRNTQGELQTEEGVSWAQIEDIYGDKFTGKMIGDGYEAFAGGCEEERRYRARWGLQDEITGWVVGFHEMRVWTFQESLLARELVHVGHNIRINTVAALVIEDYFREYEGIEAQILPVEWLPDYRKYDRLIYLRSIHLKDMQYRFPLPSQDFLKRVQGRTVWPGEATDQPEWSENQCMSLMDTQRRESLYEQDKIHGILGLFRPQVRFSLPARYDISLSAVFAILVYLRLCTGDLEALFVDEGCSRSEHQIVDAPSWIPKRYGTMVLRQPKQDQKVRPSMSGDFLRVHGRKLVITAPYLKIGECRNPEVDEIRSGDKFWLTPYNPTWDIEKQDPKYTGPNAFMYSPRGRPKFPKVDLSEPSIAVAKNQDPRISENDDDDDDGENSKPSEPSTLQSLHPEPALPPQNPPPAPSSPPPTSTSHPTETEILATRRRLHRAVTSTSTSTTSQAAMVYVAQKSGGYQLWLVLVSDDDGTTWEKVGETTTQPIMSGFDPARWVRRFVIV